MGRLDTSIVLASLVIILSSSCFADENVDRPKSRSFRLDYGVAIEDPPAGSRVWVWTPVTQSGDYHDIEPLETKLPAKERIPTNSPLTLTLAKSPTLGGLPPVAIEIGDRLLAHLIPARHNGRRGYLSI